MSKLKSHIKQTHGLELTDEETLRIEQICLCEIENIMDRWHHARDNDRETLDKITEHLQNKGLLTFFKD